MIAGDIIDGGALWQVIWVSFVAGLVLIGAMSVAIVGFARATQERRERNAGAAGAHFTLAVAATGVILAAVVLGIVVMLHKG